jgi:hypothetical protein
VFVLALLAALAIVPLARADGDPASDYLLTRATFVPPDIGASDGDVARLEQTVALARARGFTVRVAVIGTAYDLGSVSSLERRPKQYARFLSQELTLVYHGPLLIVMPNGFGVVRSGKGLITAQRVVDRLAAPGSGGAKLTQGGIDAVRALAAQAGVPVPAPAAAPGSHRSSDLVWWLGGGALLLLAAAGALTIRRRR